MSWAAASVSELARERLVLCTLLLLGLICRLIRVSQPFIDQWSWREADVAMIAENFFRHGFNIFYPQIDWGGSAPGYVGTEFPLVPFLAALLYRLFGVQAWIGRGISLAFFVVSVPLFYGLVRRISNPRSTLAAAGVYVLAPLGIFAGRSFMPDMASLSLAIAALALFAAWLEHEPDGWLFAAMSLTTSLAILVKLPTAIIGLPLLYMAWGTYGARLLMQRKLWAFAGLSLGLPLAWYAHAYRISRLYFPHHFFGEGGIGIESLEWYLGILQRTVMSGLTPVVFAAMLVGIALPSRAPSGRVFHWWLVAIVLFTVVVGQGHRHEWYHLPLVPVAAAFAGLAYDFVCRQWTRLSVSNIPRAAACVGFWLALAYLSYSAVAPLYGQQRTALWDTGQALNRLTPADALVIVADDGDPRAIYYSQRRGWHFLRNGRFEGYPADDGEAIALLEGFRREGAGYLAFPQDAVWWFGRYPGLQEHLDTHYRRLQATGDSIIYDVRSSRAQLFDGPSR